MNDNAFKIQTFIPKMQQMYFIFSFFAENATRSDLNRAFNVAINALYLLNYAQKLNCP